MNQPIIRFERPNGYTTVIAPQRDAEHGLCAHVWYEDKEMDPPKSEPILLADALEGCENDPDAIDGEFELLVAAGELIDQHVGKDWSR